MCVVRCYIDMKKYIDSKCKNGFVFVLHRCLVIYWPHMAIQIFYTLHFKHVEFKWLLFLPCCLGSDWFLSSFVEQKSCVRQICSSRQAQTHCFGVKLRYGVLLPKFMWLF